MNVSFKRYFLSFLWVQFSQWVNSNPTYDPKSSSDIYQILNSQLLFIFMIDLLLLFPQTFFYIFSPEIYVKVDM